MLNTETMQTVNVYCGGGESEYFSIDMQFFNAADEIWKPGITAGTFSDGDYVLKTNFLLISPIDKAFHKSAGELINRCKKKVCIPLVRIKLVLFTSFSEPID